MMERYGKGPIKEPAEKCPRCGSPVKVKLEDDRLALYDLNGNSHRCENEAPFEKHPIGQAVIDGVIKGFQLRGRRLTITLEDGNILSVSAAGTPLSLSLRGPDGILQE